MPATWMCLSTTPASDRKRDGRRNRGERRAGPVRLRGPERTIRYRTPREGCRRRGCACQQRRLQIGSATVEEIEANGGRGRFVSADLSAPSDIARLAKDAGDVDVLVNNAGFRSEARRSKKSRRTAGGAGSSPRT